MVMNRTLYQLRLLLHDMEKDLGLNDLSAAERDVLYVIESLAVQNQNIASHLILSHDLLKNNSRPTIYRALNILIDKNRIQRSSTVGRGVFNMVV
jgi:hypothetical protein